MFRFNLQMFADNGYPVGNMVADNHINRTTDTTLSTGNNLAPEMKIFYDKALIVEASAALVHDQFGQKRPIPKNGGKQIEFRKFSKLPKAMKSLTEGVTPKGNKLNVTTITASVAQYGDYVVQTDMLELTAIDNTILEATKLLGQQAGLTLDTVTRNAICGGTNVTYAYKTADGVETEVTDRAELDASAQLTVKTVQRIVAKLRTQNAPTINGKYVAIAHPYVLYSLMRDPEWIDAHKYANPGNLYTGEVGEIAGVRFVQTSEAKIIRGEDLASDSRTLKVDGAITADTQKTITFDGGNVAAGALAGKYIVVGGGEYLVADNTASVITIDSADNLPAIDDDAVIYPQGAGDGSSVYCTLFLGQDAYGVTEITGGGLETIVKQKGYGDDPLNQRSSVGWKAVKTAEILLDQYIVRAESCVTDFADTEAN